MIANIDLTKHTTKNLFDLVQHKITQIKEEKESILKAEREQKEKEFQELTASLNKKLGEELALALKETIIKYEIHKEKTVIISNFLNGNLIITIEDNPVILGAQFCLDWNDSTGKAKWKSSDKPFTRNDFLTELANLTMFLEAKNE